MKFIAGLLSAALLGIGIAPQAQAQTKSVVVSTAFKSVFYLPAYIAEERGFYKQQGLDVRIDVANSPTNALASVIAKSADFSLHGPEWTAISRSRGSNVQVIGGLLDGMGAWITCNPDFMFTAYKDFIGQPIATGMMPTTSTSVLFRIMRAQNIDPTNELKLIQVPVGSEAGPLLAGQAKCAVLYEPGASQAESKGMKVVIGFPTPLGPYTFSAISSRHDIDPGVAQRFVNSIQLALADIRNDPAGAVEVGKKVFPTLEPGVVEASVKRLITDKVFAQSVEVPEKALSEALQTQVDLGNLSALPTYDSLVNRAFIDKALALTRK